MKTTLRCFTARSCGNALGLPLTAEDCTFNGAIWRDTGMILDGSRWNSVFHTNNDTLRSQTKSSQASHNPQVLIPKKEPHKFKPADRTLGPLKLQRDLPPRYSGNAG